MTSDPAPERDTRWDDSEPRLVEAIRDEILRAPRQRITFARFMERALTEPGLGYYATSEVRPTRAGDFLTAPELHPFFGRCLGRFIGAVHGHAGTTPLRVLEYGGGRGTLRETASEGLGFALKWARVDLPHRSDPMDPQADLVLANEYLDALPVHRLRQAGGVREVFVGWDGSWFIEVTGELSTPALAAHLEADGVRLREGQRAEVGLAAPAWMDEAATRLVPGGVVLVIDYGHAATELYGPLRMAGSLLAYRDHVVSDDPFTAIGHTDITAHVDVTALARAASQAGLVPVGSTTQGPFLARLGLGEMLSEMGRDPRAEPQVYLDARAAVARLLDPRHLGAFRVMAWARPSADGGVPTLPGFDDTP